MKNSFVNDEEVMVEQLLLKSSGLNHNQFHRKLHRSKGMDHLHVNNLELRL